MFAFFESTYLKCKENTFSTVYEYQSVATRMTVTFLSGGVG